MTMQNCISPVPCTMPADGLVFGFHLKTSMFVGSEVKVTFLFPFHRANKGYLVNLEFKVKEVTKELRAIKDHVEILA